MQLISKRGLRDKCGGRALSTLDLDIREGLLPKPIKLGERQSAWVESEIDAVLQARAAGWQKEQIRVLVTSIHEARKTLAPKSHPSNG